MIPEIPEELTLFHDVHRAHHNAIAAALSEQGLQDVGQPKLLILLSTLEEGSVTQRELAQALHVSPATMSASLKSLERQGYVTKQSGKTDGRCKMVAITQKGLDAVQRCRNALMFVDDQIFAGFSQEEMERLKAAHRRILHNLYAIGGDRAPEGCPFIPEGKERPE